MRNSDFQKGTIQGGTFDLTAHNIRQIVKKRITGQPLNSAWREI